MLGFHPPLNEYPPPKEGEPSLHRAARIGDCAEIRRLVAAGERLDAIFDTELDPDAHPREATPFMVAAGSSDGADVETLRVLLELGADPKVEIRGRSAATFACHGLACWHKPGGDAPRLRFVLRAGCPLPADPQAANNLLCDVAATGDAERVRVLLEHGLNPRGHWDPVKARESGRAFWDTFGRSRQDQPDQFDSFPEDRRTSYREAIKRLEAEMFQKEVSAPSNLEIPLFRAAHSGNAECVRLLLQAGADAHARDNSDRTAMYDAGSDEVVRLLLQAGVPLEDADQYGWSPLVSSVGEGEEALPRVRALIAAGANVNATHDRGYTVFMSAVGSGRSPALLRLLVASGADPHATSELGFNAFHAAIEVSDEAAAEASVRDTLGYLKQLGVNIEQRNNRNQTPLALAILEGTEVEVRVLCELGADPSAVCGLLGFGDGSPKHHDLPLLFHAARLNSFDNALKTHALLRAGADPLTKDADGYTPLMHAVVILCHDAPERDESYRAFFSGLEHLRLPDENVPQSRDEFIAAVTPPLREYVEQFASAIPLPTGPEYEQALRDQTGACIVVLCAYERWARHARR